MENLKNQFGHHVIIKRSEAGEIVELNDVKILSATEYAKARDSRDAYCAKMAEEQARRDAEAALEAERTNTQLAKEAARIAGEKAYADKYSKQNLLIAWLILKIQLFEGKTMVDNDRLDQIYADLFTGEKSPEDLSKSCFEFSEVFERLTGHDI